MAAAKHTPWLKAHEAVSVGAGHWHHRALVRDASGEEVCGTIHYAVEITDRADDWTQQHFARIGRVFRSGEPFPYSANAHLIAAAPDLLAAAKALRDAQRDYMANRGDEARGARVGAAAVVLDAAIAKAEGATDHE